MPNIPHTKALRATLVENCLANGKTGMRLFRDMSAFLKTGYTKELIEYESRLEQSFHQPKSCRCTSLPVYLKLIDLNHFRQLLSKSDQIAPFSLSRVFLYHDLTPISSNIFFQPDNIL